MATYVITDLDHNISVTGSVRDVFEQIKDKNVLLKLSRPVATSLPADPEATEPKEPQELITEVEPTAALIRSELKDNPIITFVRASGEPSDEEATQGWLIKVHVFH